MTSKVFYIDKFYEPLFSIKTTHSLKKKKKKKKTTTTKEKKSKSLEVQFHLKQRKCWK